MVAFKQMLDCRYVARDDFINKLNCQTDRQTHKPKLNQSWCRKRKRYKLSIAPFIDDTKWNGCAVSDFLVKDNE